MARSRRGPLAFGPALVAMLAFAAPPASATVATITVNAQDQMAVTAAVTAPTDLRISVADPNYLIEELRSDGTRIVPVFRCDSISAFKATCERGGVQFIK